MNSICLGERCSLVECQNYHPNPVCDCGRRCPPMKNRPGRYYTKCSPNCMQMINRFQSQSVASKKMIECMIPINKIIQVLESKNPDLNLNFNTNTYKDPNALNFIWGVQTSRGGTNMSVWGHLLSDADRETIFIPMFCALFFSMMSADPNHWVQYINNGIATIINYVLNDPNNIYKELTMRRVLEFAY